MGHLGSWSVDQLAFPGRDLFYYIGRIEQARFGKEHPLSRWQHRTVSSRNQAS